MAPLAEERGSCVEKDTQEMPKVKTHKSAVKRFHQTGTGKLMHRRTKRAHSMTKKSPQSRRRLYNESVVDSGKRKAVLRQMQNGANY